MNNKTLQLEDRPLDELVGNIPESHDRTEDVMTIENVAALDELILMINGINNQKIKSILLDKVTAACGKDYVDAALTVGRIRRRGRKAITEKYPNILETIEKIIEKNTYDGLSREQVASKLSSRKISSILKSEYKMEASYPIVCKLMREMGYNSSNASKKRGTQRQVISL